MFEYAAATFDKYNSLIPGMFEQHGWILFSNIWGTRWITVYSVGAISMLLKMTVEFLIYWPSIICIMS